MSLKTQAKVLRALQEQRVEPVGGSGSVDVDVRVIAATNKDLEAEIRAGRFREDLYFRLNVIPFQVPPLRDRREDIPLLVRHFMQVLSAEHGRKAREVVPDALEALARLPWPGNVRELRNILERLVIMTPGERIELQHLPATLAASLPARAPAADESSPAASGDGTLLAAREAFERRYILERYRECGGNMSRTAESLGVERSNLYRKMKAFGLLPARRDQADGAFEA
jgi:two-component system nitrogen regulation response regulator NtrX